MAELCATRQQAAGNVCPGLQQPKIVCLAGQKLCASRAELSADEHEEYKFTWPEGTALVGPSPKQGPLPNRAHERRYVRYAIAHNVYYVTGHAVAAGSTASQRTFDPPMP